MTTTARHAREQEKSHTMLDIVAGVNTVAIVRNTKAHAQTAEATRASNSMTRWQAKAYQARGNPSVDGIYPRDMVKYLQGKEPPCTMKKYTLLVIIFVSMCIITTADILIARTIREDQKVEQLPPPADPLSHPQRAWLGALEWCESKGRPQAINPKDRDNTPSYGILQFKPSTLTYFGKMYGIAGDIMNPDTQEAIVEQMILQGGIDWHQQFPVCSGILGKPPHSLST